MFNFIDTFIHQTTIHRLVLYVLTAFLVAAMVLGLVGVLRFGPLEILFSTAFLITVCLVVNAFFAQIFKINVRIESSYITALILALVIDPISLANVSGVLPFALLASILSVASKYLLVFRKKHFFNPAAIGLVLTAFVFGQFASWWIGTKWMLPLLVLGGFLIVHKFRRYDLVLSFVVASSAVLIYFAGDWSLVYRSAPILLFFGTVMLTEPLTTPPGRWRRIAYGAIVGFLFLPSLHFGTIYMTPELALVLGNLFSRGLST